MTDDLADRLVVTLDLDGVDDKAAFMERIAYALGLPEWFGRNWDALADSLNDRTVWPSAAVERGLLLVVRGWQRYATVRPEEWGVAREVFSEAVERTPGLSVALALGGSHENPVDLPG
ncbi:barstar family protein [Streptomyces chiangmaiensis]|uniref:Barstar family protein n=1 Tax=Streptomyces chiangmaiensis TaxID=766497 RepID=A0ABU7F8X3_9ACTN|nr:barstar family protein [Streptomyces chiangmaiensis]MED7820647.1 barstar family protein [Streptomyces chiangmaiensis]